MNWLSRQRQGRPLRHFLFIRPIMDLAVQASFGSLVWTEICVCGGVIVERHGQNSRRDALQFYATSTMRSGPSGTTTTLAAMVTTQSRRRRRAL